MYLCTADADGMMVSLIQSNYMGFGSYVVAPGTGATTVPDLTGRSP